MTLRKVCETEHRCYSIHLKVDIRGQWWLWSDCHPGNVKYTMHQMCHSRSALVFDIFYSVTEVRKVNNLFPHGNWPFIVPIILLWSLLKDKSWTLWFLTRFLYPKSWSLHFTENTATPHPVSSENTPTHQVVSNFWKLFSSFTKFNVVVDDSYMSFDHIFSVGGAAWLCHGFRSFRVELVQGDRVSPVWYIQVILLVVARSKPCHHSWYL